MKNSMFDLNFKWHLNERKNVQNDLFVKYNTFV